MIANKTAYLSRNCFFIILLNTWVIKFCSVFMKSCSARKNIDFVNENVKKQRLIIILQKVPSQ